MKNPSFRFVLAASCHDDYGFQKGAVSFGNGKATEYAYGASDALFTGKPEVEGLGYAFLFRNYRAGLGKWQTADPLGYPDGWNQLAYCGNGLITHVDYLGAVDINLFPTNEDIHNYADNYNDPNNITVGGHGNSSGVSDPITSSPMDP